MLAIVIFKFLKQLAPVVGSFAGVALMTSVVGTTFAASEGHVAHEPTPLLARVDGSINVTPNVVDIGQTTSVTLTKCVWVLRSDAGGGFSDRYSP